MNLPLRSIYLLLLTSLLNVGCASPEPIIDPVVDPDDGTLITTKITIQGAIIVGDEEPLVLAGRSTSKSDDLYGIQIYSCLAADKEEPYAYGLFDSSDIPPIELVENRLYRVELAVVKNGCNVIGRDKGTENYRLPFTTMSKGTPVNNSFEMSTSRVFNGLSQGVVELPFTDAKGYKKYELPIMDRYAALIDNFSPNSGAPIELKARRVGFGLRPKTEGLTEGYVKVTFSRSTPLNGATEFILKAEEQGAPVEYIFGFKGGVMGSYDWLGDEYTEEITFNATQYDASDNEVVELAKGHKISVQRNYSYELIIKTRNSSSLPSISFEDVTFKSGDPIVIGN